jgi:hypothetical protein
MITAQEARKETVKSGISNILLNIEKAILIEAQEGNRIVKITLKEQTQQSLNKIVLTLKNNGFKVDLHIGFFDEIGLDTFLITW